MNGKLAMFSPVGNSTEADTEYVKLLANATFTAGSVVVCVMDSDGNYTSASEVTAASLGTTDTAICSDGIFAVVAADVTSGSIGTFYLRGSVSAIVLSTANAAILIDAGIFANTSEQLEFDAGTADTNKKLIALTTATAQAGTTATPASRTVFFDGIEGFGRHGGT